MKKSRNKPLDFVIDKLTNSVENTSTGEVFNTEIVRLTLKDLKQIHKAEWQFDWTNEIKDKTKEVYKVYLGVPGNLVAYACKVSVDKGYQGFLAFDAKTALIKHYKESLYATHFRGLRMFIETNAAMRLISQYFES